MNTLLLTSHSSVLLILIVSLPCCRYIWYWVIESLVLLFNIIFHFLRVKDWYGTKRQSILGGRYWSRSSTFIDDWQLWATWNFGETQTTSTFVILFTTFFRYFLPIFSNLFLRYNVVLRSNSNMVSFIILCVICKLIFIWINVWSMKLY